MGSASLWRPCLVHQAHNRTNKEHICTHRAGRQGDTRRILLHAGARPQCLSRNVRRYRCLWIFGRTERKAEQHEGGAIQSLLDRIIDLVETSRSGNYIDTESAAFSDKNATAIESYYHLVKSGQLEGTIAKSAEKTFDAQAVQRLLDKFQSDREVSLLGLVQDDPELNHPLRLSLKDISSANQPESTDSNEAFARKLRDLDK